MIGIEFSAMQWRPFPLWASVVRGPIHENFEKKILSIGGIEKLSFFESAMWNFFLASFPSKSVKASWLAMLDRNFDDYPSFQPKTTAAYKYVIQCIKDINLSNIKTDRYHTSILQESWLHLIFILLMLFLGFFSSCTVFNYSYCFRYYHSNWGQ